MTGSGGIHMVGYTKVPIVYSITFFEFFYYCFWLEGVGFLDLTNLTFARKKLGGTTISGKYLFHFSH